MNSNLIDVSFEDIINKEVFSAFEEDITCTICSNIYFDPMECSSCRNNFCSECIRKWQREKYSCIFRCTNSIIIPANRTLKNLLSKILFRCKECQEDVQYDSIKAHKKDTVCFTGRVAKESPLAKREEDISAILTNYIDKIDTLEKDKRNTEELLVLMRKENESLKDLNTKQYTEILNIKQQYEIIKSNYYKLREERKAMEEEKKNREEENGGKRKKIKKK